MFSNIFTVAKAHIKGSSNFPKINGIVTFKQLSTGIILTAKIYNLPKSNSPCRRQILWVSYS